MWWSNSSFLQLTFLFCADGIKEEWEQKEEDDEEEEEEEEEEDE